MSLPSISIRNPVFAWMLMAGFIVFGLIALRRLGVGQYPDVDFPVVTITVTREGAAPEIMESEVVDVIEDTVMAVEGIKELTSTSQEGRATITIEFEISRDVDLALQDVQARVSAAARLLPNDIDPPAIAKTNPEENPIMWLALTGTRPPQELTEYAKNVLRDRFLTVPGDGDVNMGGTLARNVRIWIDPDKLVARGLAVDDVISAIQRQHSEVPAGRVEGKYREANVRVQGEALSVKEWEGIEIAQINGVPIHLKDIAIVEDGFEDVRRVARINGMPAQGLGIIKQHGANSVALAEAVYKRVDELNKTLPQGMELSIRADNTRFVREAIAETEQTLVLSVLLTALVCWLFLGSLSSTFNVILAIPVSVFGTFAVMYFCGFTLNTFTILALSLSIGIVVDDAVMVLENIYRHAEMGKRRQLAAKDGAEQISFAALAASIAIVAIFLPVAFMTGIIGKFFFQFGVVLSVAVLISLIEALTLAPARCAQFLSVGQRQNVIERTTGMLFNKLSSWYEWCLRRTLRWRLTVILASTGIFVLSMFIFPVLPKEMVPAQDQGVYMVRLTTPVGSTIDYTDKVVAKMTEVINNHEEIDSIFAISGSGDGQTNNGLAFVTMKPREQRKIKQPDGTMKYVTQQESINQLRKDLDIFPGTRITTVDFSQAGFASTKRGGLPIDFTIRGPDWDTLGGMAEVFMTEMKAGGQMVDIDTDYRKGMPEIDVVPNREKTLAHNVDILTLGNAISNLIGGNKIAKYKSNGRLYDVRLRMLRPGRTMAEDIGKLYVHNKTGDLVKVSELVDVQVKPALQSITRVNRERAVGISANPAPGISQDAAIREVERIAKEKLPEGYRVIFSGNSLAFKDALMSLLFALFLGLIVAYMVLASQFNSFLHPITVFIALPFSFSGALIALYLTHQSINVYSAIGLILLMGIVKKNSILLVDFTNQCREEGLPCDVALVKACPMRLRPILMTSVATIAGALPGALSLGAGGELRIPMSMAVIGGVLLSTLLTLFVVPSFYSLADQLKHMLVKSIYGDKLREVEELPHPAHAPSTGHATVKSTVEVSQTAK